MVQFFMKVKKNKYFRGVSAYFCAVLLKFPKYIACKCSNKGKRSAQCQVSIKCLDLTIRTARSIFVLKIVTIIILEDLEFHYRIDIQGSETPGTAFKCHYSSTHPETYRFNRSI